MRGRDTRKTNITMIHAMANCKLLRQYRLLTETFYLLSKYNGSAATQRVTLNFKERKQRKESSVVAISITMSGFSDMASKR